MLSREELIHENKWLREDRNGWQDACEGLMETVAWLNKKNHKLEATIVALEGFIASLNLKERS